MKFDCMEFSKKYDKYQQFAPISKAYPEEFTTMTSPWPFVVWGIDLIGQFPKGNEGAQHTVVTLDYFTKWIKVEALAVYKKVICRYGVPHTIVSDKD